MTEVAKATYLQMQNIALKEQFCNSSETEYSYLLNNLMFINLNESVFKFNSLIQCSCRSSLQLTGGKDFQLMMTF